MATPTSTRIYITDRDSRYDFLWADAGEDGSIYFGLLGTGIQTIEQIAVGSEFDYEGTTFHTFNGPHKVSFHASGQCVLSNLMESGGERIRVRSQGIPLAQVETPTRMLDVITPVANLGQTQKGRPATYIDLHCNLSSSTHICCTVYCMPEGLLSEFGQECAATIRGSTWQSTNALASAGKAWHFTLHDAVDPSTKRQCSIVSIHGCGTRSRV